MRQVRSYCVFLLIFTGATKKREKIDEDQRSVNNEKKTKINESQSNHNHKTCQVHLVLSNCSTNTKLNVYRAQPQIVSYIGKELVRISKPTIYL